MPGADPSRTPDDPTPRPGATAQTGPRPRPGATPAPAPGRPGRQRPTPAGRTATSRPDGTTGTAPAPTPARPTPTAPAPTPVRPTPAGPSTGRAPVDAVPRRVPVRQHSRWHLGARRTDSDTPPDGDDGTFWAPIEQVHWDGTPVREDPAPERDRGSGAGRPRTPARATPPPDPLPGLAVLVLLSLVAAFFAWVSAGPFWLAVGHSRVGTVVIDNCTGGGLTQRCRGIFTADDGRFLAHGVRVSGVPAGRDVPGTALPARLAGSDGGTAYVDTGVARHLRWLPGLLMVLGCAAGIARWTGATRLPDRRNRRWAVAVAIAGPVLITLGFLAAAW
ncbi:hypothetical protein SAMN04489832_5453 [Micromonospora cremea]|uniref:Uncharacterized protein n=1 Tax=Micromonospora cremea TaxID=709881 RepID=A0A1N6AFR4_9ACTN|nr:hypothetical protein SAMN04489832_5453 [Micromonospora cremea]